jgi:lipopolysaccharide/colanic/teichoic acid biosynthesis glycosyltransferase
MIDIIGAILGLIILSPLFFLISIIIKISSKGPVFYRQVRIGRDGKPFMFYKFRSMFTRKGGDHERERVMIEFMKNDCKQNGEDTKIIVEERVTKIGRIIRKTSLDELPQLINVLKGDMSLVGPRPCLLYEYKNYDEWQKRRLSVLPGCTGVWQVSGRSKVSFKDSIVLDIYYVNNMSPWFDLQLIFKTFPVMLLGKGGK